MFWETLLVQDGSTLISGCSLCETDNEDGEY